MHRSSTPPARHPTHQGASVRRGSTGLLLTEAPEYRDVLFIWRHAMSILVVLFVGGLICTAAIMLRGVAGGLPSAALVAFAGYILAALVSNRSRVHIDARTLSVTPGPLPWPGNKSVRNDDVADLRLCRTRDDEGTPLFHVRWIDRHGEQHPFLSYLHSAEQGREMIEHLAPLLHAGSK